eukprot:gnl/Chilomastix_cuspidata/3061.p1 GENE.gnl/Chilomastix_cuspidata/3061~~gnl/Chilomastix_cuspidata/3061.p1  ORF type:complete len:2647 (+),score=362.10 gnl/Chilomastix_cuspidata/3061:48-7988(+)
MEGNFLNISTIARPFVSRLKNIAESNTRQQSSNAESLIYQLSLLVQSMVAFLKEGVLVKDHNEMKYWLHEGLPLIIKDIEAFKVPTYYEIDNALNFLKEINILIMELLRRRIFSTELLSAFSGIFSHSKKAGVCYAADRSFPKYFGSLKTFGSRPKIGKAAALVLEHGFTAGLFATILESLHQPPDNFSTQFPFSSPSWPTASSLNHILNVIRETVLCLRPSDLLSCGGALRAAVASFFEHIPPDVLRDAEMGYLGAEVYRTRNPLFSTFKQLRTAAEGTAADPRSFSGERTPEGADRRKGYEQFADKVLLKFAYKCLKDGKILSLQSLGIDIFARFASSLDSATVVKQAYYNPRRLLRFFESRDVIQAVLDKNAHVQIATRGAPIVKILVREQKLRVDFFKDLWDSQQSTDAATSWKRDQLKIFGNFVSELSFEEIFCLYKETLHDSIVRRGSLTVDGCVLLSGIICKFMAELNHPERLPEGVNPDELQEFLDYCLKISAGMQLSPDEPIFDRPASCPFSPEFIENGLTPFSRTPFPQEHRDHILNGFRQGVKYLNNESVSVLFKKALLMLQECVGIGTAEAILGLCFKYRRSTKNIDTILQYVIKSFDVYARLICLHTSENQFTEEEVLVPGGIKHGEALNIRLRLIETCFSSRKANISAEFLSDLWTSCYTKAVISFDQDTLCNWFVEVDRKAHLSKSGTKGVLTHLFQVICKWVSSYDLKQFELIPCSTAFWVLAEKCVEKYMFKNKIFIKLPTNTHWLCKTPNNEASFFYFLLARKGKLTSVAEKATDALIEILDNLDSDNYSYMHRYRADTFIKKLLSETWESMYKMSTTYTRLEDEPDKQAIVLLQIERLLRFSNELALFAFRGESYKVVTSDLKPVQDMTAVVNYYGTDLKNFLIPLDPTIGVIRRIAAKNLMVPPRFLKIFMSGETPRPLKDTDSLKYLNTANLLIIEYTMGTVPTNLSYELDPFTRVLQEFINNFKLYSVLFELLPISEKHFPQLTYLIELLLYRLPQSTYIEKKLDQSRLKEAISLARSKCEAKYYTDIWFRKNSQHKGNRKFSRDAFYILFALSSKKVFNIDLLTKIVNGALSIFSEEALNLIDQGIKPIQMLAFSDHLPSQAADSPVIPNFKRLVDPEEVFNCADQLLGVGDSNSELKALVQKVLVSTWVCSGISPVAFFLKQLEKGIISPGLLITVSLIKAFSFDSAGEGNAIINAICKLKEIEDIYQEPYFFPVISLLKSCSQIESVAFVPLANDILEGCFVIMEEKIGYDYFLKAFTVLSQLCDSKLVTSRLVPYVDALIQRAFPIPSYVLRHDLLKHGLVLERPSDASLELLRFCIQISEEVSAKIFASVSFVKPNIMPAPTLPLTMASVDNVGIRNVGSSCYLNSLVQLLFHVPFFRLSILRMNPQPHQFVLSTLKEFFLKLLTTVSTHIEPEKLIDNLRAAGLHIVKGEQQDASDFLLQLLAQLENELVDTADAHLVHEIFGFQRATQFIGQESCTHKKETFSDDKILSLPVKNYKSIEESLQSELKGNMLSGSNAYFCSKCEEKRATIHRQIMSSLPNYLLCHLQRFLWWDQASKINDKFLFPNELNMYLFSRESQLNDDPGSSREAIPETLAELKWRTDASYYNYSLKGIIVHSGSVTHGHYYTFVRSGEMWVELNDTKVTARTFKEVLERSLGGKDLSGNDTIVSAYMLLYERDGLLVPPADDQVGLVVEGSEEGTAPAASSTSLLQIQSKMICFRDSHEMLEAEDLPQKEISIGTFTAHIGAASHELILKKEDFEAMREENRRLFSSQAILEPNFILLVRDIGVLALQRLGFEELIAPAPLTSFGGQADNIERCVGIVQDRFRDSGEPTGVLDERFVNILANNIATCVLRADTPETWRLLEVLLPLIICSAQLQEKIFASEKNFEVQISEFAEKIILETKVGEVAVLMVLAYSYVFRGEFTSLYLFYLKSSEWTAYRGNFFKLAQRLASVPGLGAVLAQSSFFMELLSYGSCQGMFFPVFLAILPYVASEITLTPDFLETLMRTRNAKPGLKAIILGKGGAELRDSCLSQGVILYFEAGYEPLQEVLAQIAQEEPYCLESHRGIFLEHFRRGHNKQKIAAFSILRHLIRSHTDISPHLAQLFVGQLAFSENEALRRAIEAFFFSLVGCGHHAASGIDVEYPRRSPPSCDLRPLVSILLGTLRQLAGTKAQAAVPDRGSARQRAPDRRAVSAELLHLFTELIHPAFAAEADEIVRVFVAELHFFRCFSKADPHFSPESELAFLQLLRRYVLYTGNITPFMRSWLGFFLGLQQDPKNPKNVPAVYTHDECFFVATMLGDCFTRAFAYSGHDDAAAKMPRKLLGPVLNAAYDIFTHPCDDKHLHLMRLRFLARSLRLSGRAGYLEKRIQIDFAEVQKALAAQDEAKASALLFLGTNSDATFAALWNDSMFSLLSQLQKPSLWANRTTLCTLLRPLELVPRLTLPDTEEMQSFRSATYLLVAKSLRALVSPEETKSEIPEACDVPTAEFLECMAALLVFFSKTADAEDDADVSVFRQIVSDFPLGRGTPLLSSDPFHPAIHSLIDWALGPGSLSGQADTLLALFPYEMLVGSVRVYAAWQRLPEGAQAEASLATLRKWGAAFEHAPPHPLFRRAAPE